MRQKMKTGVIDVGGGFRGIFGAGVFDACIDEGISFDYCIGVSAGSANISSFLAKQKGRNIPFYTEFGFRKEYASFENLRKKDSYLDLNYVYGTLSNHDGEKPLDYETMMDSPAEFYIVTCNALTGETIYLNKKDIKKDHYDAFKASSALPVVCHPYVVDGIPCFDGGLGDPVPVVKAFADGCDKVVLILTKPRDFVRSEKKDQKAVEILQKTYPEAAKQLALRYKKYNDSVVLAKEYEKQGRLLIVAPDNSCGMTTLLRTRLQLEHMYQKGYSGAATIYPFIKV